MVSGPSTDCWYIHLNAKNKHTSVYTFITIQSKIHSKLLVYYNNYLSVMIFNIATVSNLLEIRENIYLHLKFLSLDLCLSMSLTMKSKLILRNKSASISRFTNITFLVTLLFYLDFYVLPLRMHNINRYSPF